MVNWAIRTRASRERFLRLLDQAGLKTDCVVRFEPALNRALQFAKEEGLVTMRALASGGLRVALTEEGRALADRLLERGDVLSDEIRFLESIRGRVSEDTVKALLNWEGSH